MVAMMIITLVSGVSTRIPTIQTIEFSSMHSCVQARESILKDYEQNLSDRSRYSVVCASNLKR